MILARYNPKIIVYDVNPSFDLLKGDNAKYLGDLRTYWQEPGVSNVVYSVDSCERYKLKSMMYCYNSIWLQMLSDNIRPQSSNEKGFVGVNKVMEYEPTKSEATSSITYDTLKLFYLERFIQDCKHHHVTLLFSLSPLYRANSIEVFQPLESLCKKYGVPLINHYNDRRFSTNRNYFYDSVHMNRTGAIAFSSCLASELKRIIENKITMGIIKELSRFAIYLVKRKSYKVKVYNGCEIESLKGLTGREYFHGYYDKSPEQNGKVLYHEMGMNKVSIILKDLVSGEERQIGVSNAFNWQMGARALWIDDEIVSYNDFEDGKYISKWVSVSNNTVVKKIPMPTMDIWKQKYILTTNFQRLRSVDPHYSYNCLPEMDEDTFRNYEHDGVWMFDIEKEEKKLLLSISEILKCKGNLLYEEGRHAINHIMIAPDGQSFIFIHRYKYNGKRYDRLMFYDFKNLKCLLDDPVQSHFCWLDADNIMGYCEYEDKIGWYEINTKSGEVKKLEELTKAHPKNGHPTPYGKWIVVDSYPDLSRMQSLYAYNRDTKEVILLAEFFHDLKHKEYTRCDLHPRFTDDGKAIYIDTLYSGKRQLCKLCVNLN